MKSNGQTLVFPHTHFNPYKYYIGRGNNSVIVRAALKNRFWWSIGDYDNGTWYDYHFMWTQWKSNRIINGLKTQKELEKTEKGQEENE